MVTCQFKPHGVLIIVIICISLVVNCQIPGDYYSGSTEWFDPDTSFGIEPPLVSPNGEKLLLQISHRINQRGIRHDKYSSYQSRCLYADIRVVVMNIDGSVEAEEVLSRENAPDSISYDMKSINDSLVLISLQYGYLLVYNYLDGELRPLGQEYYPWSGWSVSLLPDSRVVYCRQDAEGTTGNLVWYTTLYTGTGKLPGVASLRIPGMLELSKGIHKNRSTTFLFSAGVVDGDYPKTDEICFVDFSTGSYGSMIPFNFGWSSRYHNDVYAAGDSGLMVWKQDTVSFYEHNGNQFNLTSEQVIAGMSLSQSPLSSDGKLFAYSDAVDSLARKIVVASRDSVLVGIRDYLFDDIFSQLDTFQQ